MNLNFSNKSRLKKIPRYLKRQAKRIPCQVFSIDWTPPFGYKPLNPSICIYNNRLVLTVRTFIYKERKAEKLWHIDNVNYLLELEKETLNFCSIKKIDYPHLPIGCFKNTAFGFEDSRLFLLNNELWSVSTARQLYEHNYNRIVVSKIKQQGDRCCFSDWFVVEPSHIDFFRHEKNWSPVVVQDQLFFVYSHNPLTVLNKFGKVVSKISNKLPRFRGGTQLVPFLDGYISLIHEKFFKPCSEHILQNPIYYHRFVFYDRNLVVKKMSDPFYFLEPGIEFAAGACFSEDYLLVSFGFKDESAKIAKIETSYIFNSLFSVD